jgi:DNA-binding NarL/FixJ family response regulator
MKELTEQEKIILCNVAVGYNNSQIGKLCYISVHTVKAHIGSILKKLEAKNRAHAVYIAVKNNIINI